MSLDWEKIMRKEEMDFREDDKKNFTSNLDASMTRGEMKMKKN